MSVSIDRFKKAFTGEVSPDLLANREGKVREALRGLKSAVDTLKAAGSDAERTHRTTLNELVTRFANISRSTATVAAKYEDLDDVKAEAREAQADALADAKRVDVSRNPVAGLFKAVNVSGTGDKALKQQAVQAFTADPTVLQTLMGQEGGKAVLDRLVSSIGDTAGTAKEKELVLAAIKARYAIDDLSAQTEAKSLPRFYKAMALIPENHTLNNESLKQIKYEARDDTSTYGDKVININVANVSVTDNFDPDGDVKPEWKASAKNVNRFDYVTLHEIGHSVDAQLSFMDTRLEDDTFGGWKKYTATALADHLGTRMGLFKDYPTQPKGGMVAFLVDVLGGNQKPKVQWETRKMVADGLPTPEELRGDAGFQHICTQIDLLDLKNVTSDALVMLFRARESEIKLDPTKAYSTSRIKEIVKEKRIKPMVAYQELADEARDATDPPSGKAWDDLMNHAAVKFALLVATADPWKLGKSHATKVDLDGYAYVRDASKYFRYHLGVRSKCVSQYQFNGPPEWFAELYASYYLDRIPPSHPDYGWFETKIHGATFHQMSGS